MGLRARGVRPGAPGDGTGRDPARAAGARAAAPGQRHGRRALGPGHAGRSGGAGRMRGSSRWGVGIARRHCAAWTSHRDTYSVDFSHFFAAMPGEPLSWQVGVYVESPPETRDEVLKILNEIRSQTP